MSLYTLDKRFGPVIRLLEHAFGVKGADAVLDKAVAYTCLALDFIDDEKGITMLGDDPHYFRFATDDITDILGWSDLPLDQLMGREPADLSGYFSAVAECEPVELSPGVSTFWSLDAIAEKLEISGFKRTSEKALVFGLAVAFVQKNGAELSFVTPIGLCDDEVKEALRALKSPKPETTPAKKSDGPRYH